MVTLGDRIREGRDIWAQQAKQETPSDQQTPDVRKYLQKLNEADPIEAPRELTPEEKHAALSATLMPAGSVTRGRLAATEASKKETDEQFRQVVLPPLSNKS